MCWHYGLPEYCTILLDHDPNYQRLAYRLILKLWLKSVLSFRMEDLLINMTRYVVIDVLWTLSRVRTQTTFTIDVLDPRSTYEVGLRLLRVGSATQELEP